MNTLCSSLAPAAALMLVLISLDSAAFINMPSLVLLSFEYEESQAWGFLLGLLLIALCTASGLLWSLQNMTADPLATASYNPHSSSLIKERDGIDRNLKPIKQMMAKDQETTASEYILYCPDISYSNKPGYQYAPTLPEWIQATLRKCTVTLKYASIYHSTLVMRIIARPLPIDRGTTRGLILTLLWGALLGAIGLGCGCASASMHSRISRLGTLFCIAGAALWMVAGVPDGTHSTTFDSHRRGVLVAISSLFLALLGSGRHPAFTKRMLKQQGLQSSYFIVSGQLAIGLFGVYVCSASGFNSVKIGSLLQAGAPICIYGLLSRVLWVLGIILKNGATGIDLRSTQMKSNNALVSLALRGAVLLPSFTANCIATLCSHSVTWAVLEISTIMIGGILTPIVALGFPAALAYYNVPNNCIVDRSTITKILMAIAGVFMLGTYVADIQPLGMQLPLTDLFCDVHHFLCKIIREC